MGFLAALLVPALGVGAAGILVPLVYVPIVVFAFMQTIKRSHDMGWSGWTSLLTLIPLVGLIWIFKSDNKEANNYGAPPPPNTIGVKIMALLLPAIFIIGIVAAVAIPAYSEYARRAAGAP